MANQTIPPNSLVFVIDDDLSIRKALSRLLRATDYKNEIFSSAADFLARTPHPGPSCVIVDVRMPGLNGIKLQETLIQRRRQEQLIFITGHGNIPMCAQAMKAGAVDFLPKPFRNSQLLQCVERALARSAGEQNRVAERNNARQLLDLLTPREFEVMQLVATGMLNKQIAGELGTTEKTVKVHRGRVMQKLKITSAAELVHLTHKAAVPPIPGYKTKV
jgi:FixJ family two-component response regulator